MTLIMLIANSSGSVAVLDRQQSLSTLPLYLKPQIVICQDRGVTNYMGSRIQKSSYWHRKNMQTNSLSKAPVSASVDGEHKWLVITTVIWLDKKSHVSFISSTSQRVSAGRDGRLQKNTHCFIGCFITWYGEREMMITNRFTPKSPDNVRSGICRLRVPTRNKWNDANC